MAGVAARVFHRRRWTTLTCLECLRPWPCAAFRDLLPGSSVVQQAAASVYMADEARRAYQEGIEASPALIVRFFFWLRLSDEDAVMLTEELFPYGGHVPTVPHPFRAP